ncbi:hypothetical protein C0J52_02469 [Blattella germanica]|nr:hypothetical protein C0J52_02469 [Blattella germanica]
MITSKPPYKNQIEGLNPHLERYLELLESEDSGVLDNMISNLEQFNRHISGFTSAESIDRYFKFITDSDMKRRLKFASLVQYVIFEHCWLRHKMFEIQAVEDPFLLCDHDKMEFKRAMPLLEKCLFLLNEASITSLQKKLGKLQRTLIVSITALGSVPMDCVLLPCVSLLFMFIQHPLSVTLPIAMNGLNRIIEERGMTAVQIYVRFKPEICNLMADFIVLNHIMGGSAITTSIQRLVRALGFENLRDFLQKDAHNFLPYLLPSSMKSSQSVRLLEGLGQSMMVDMKVLFEKTFQYVYPHVFLTCDERTRQRCFRYIERVTETSLRQLRLANFKMIHNELLLRYCDNPDQALAALCQFAHDDEDYKIEVEPMSLSDIVSNYIIKTKNILLSMIQDTNLT